MIGRPRPRPPQATTSRRAPAHIWDTGDSCAGRYAEACDAMFDVRNVAQLTEVILTLT